MVLFHYLSFIFLAAENSTAELNSCLMESDMTRVGGQDIVFYIVQQSQFCVVIWPYQLDKFC
jgi:hypothetical protein